MALRQMVKNSGELGIAEALLHLKIVDIQKSKKSHAELATIMS